MALTSVNNKLLESNFTCLVVALFVLSTAFYVFPAGQIQPGHYLALIIILIGSSFIRWDTLNSSEKLLAIFGGYALTINVFYYFNLQSKEFLSSISYWAYNILLFISLNHIIPKSYKVRASIRYIFLLCLLIIFALWSLNYNRNDVSFGTRFIGQFNDPNQAGYWLMCAFLGLFFFANKGFWHNCYFQLNCLIIVAVLIFATESRSAIIGLIPLTLGFIWLRFFKEEISLLKPIFKFSLVITLLIIAVSLSAKKNNIDTLNTNTFSTQEVATLNRLTNTKWYSEAKIRGYFRPFEFPKYLLFGAGQGNDARFDSPHEIHSSFLSIFFYYGIFGLIFFLGFLYQIFRRLSLPEALMLSAPFVYGLFTYGLRTPIFWVLMAIVVATRPIVLKTFDSPSKQVLNAN
jgi:hypothetical protein